MSKSETIKKGTTAIKKRVVGLEEKLFLLQNEIGALSKDTKSGIWSNHSYFTINQLLRNLKPLLQKYKLLLMQPLESRDSHQCLITKIKCIDTDKEISSDLFIEPQDNPQKMGSALTYYRRYMLVSFLALEADDDDADLAVSENKEIDNKDWLNFGTKEYENCIEKLQSKEISMKDIYKHYKLNKKVKNELESLNNI